MVGRRPSSAVRPGFSTVDARDEFSYSTVSVHDVDGYSRAVAGVSIDALRNGKGGGATKVATAKCEHLTMSNCRIGFPTLSSTTVGDNHLIVAKILSVPPEGSTWCDIDLKPGAIVTYAPTAEHTAVNNPGLEFTFVLANLARLEEMASRLGVTPTFPQPGQVQEIARSDMTVGTTKAYKHLRAVTTTGASATRALCNEVLRSMVRALTEPERPNSIGNGRRIDSRLVVRNCIDYAYSIQRIPSVAELCLAAHVSERRLRQAFTDLFDMPPTLFFRLWALKLANARLLDAAPGERTVTLIASHLGFLHFGRFAGHYKELYGEAPSDTLKRGAASVG